MDDITNRIVAGLKDPGLIDMLVNRLSGSVLNSVLLDVFSKRTEKLLPAGLVKQYAVNRLVKPAPVDVIKLKEQELAVYKLFVKGGYDPVELSPVTQLGACSVVATVDQQKVLTALRNTEVQADPANAIALHYAYLKKAGHLKAGVHRFCCVARLLRTPMVKVTGHTPHFSVGCLITAGPDRGNFEFEKLALFEHLSVHLQLFREVYGIQDIGFRIIPLKGYPDSDALITACVSFLQSKENGIAIAVLDKNDTQHYYRGFQVKTIINIKGQPVEIADGGFVDWTQQLLGNRKERMFISGIGIEYLHHLTAGK